MHRADGFGHVCGGLSASPGDDAAGSCALLHQTGRFRLAERDAGTQRARHPSGGACHRHRSRPSHESSADSEDPAPNTALTSARIRSSP